MTSRQFEKIIKENIPKVNDEFLKISIKENKSNRVVNAIAQHLVNNLNCASY